ncbi:MAG: hypothetical protein KGH66_03190 [Candidatus Micrarchaeota archaeon]|nr:hypothetical protein [Candidatus Micrarchaeota archaeon]
MALNQASRIRAGAADAGQQGKVNARPEIGEELAEKGFAIRAMEPGFLKANERLLSDPKISHVKMQFNGQYQLCIPELLGFGGPAIAIFNRGKRNAVGPEIEKIFNKANPNADPLKLRVLTKWMHKNMLYTSTELLGLKSKFGEKDHYTNEEYRQSYTQIVNIRESFIRAGKRISPPVLRLDSMADWNSMLRVRIGKEVSDNGFAIYPAKGAINAEGKRSMEATGINVVKSTRTLSRGAKDGSTGTGPGFGKPLAIFFSNLFNNERKRGLIKELEARYFGSSPEQGKSDKVFYGWLRRSGISAGVLTETGKPIVRGNSIKP